MFRLFGTAVNPTRFEICFESTLLLPILNKLRFKEKELKKAAKNNGAESLDYRKYLILFRLLAHIDEEIAAFNSCPCRATQDSEIQDVIELIKELAEFTKQLYYSHPYSTLWSIPRNYYRQGISNAVAVGARGAAIAAFFTMPLSWPVGAAAFLVGAPVANRAIQAMTGLNDQVPETDRLLGELVKILDGIIKNLDFAIPEHHPMFASASD